MWAIELNEAQNKQKNKNNEAQSLTLLHAMKSEAPTRDDVMIKCDIIKVRLQLSSFNILLTMQLQCALSTFPPHPHLDLMSPVTKHIPVWLLNKPKCTLT